MRRSLVSILIWAKELKFTAGPFEVGVAALWCLAVRPQESCQILADLHVASLKQGKWSLPVYCESFLRHNFQWKFKEVSSGHC